MISPHQSVISNLFSFECDYMRISRLMVRGKYKFVSDFIPIVNVHPGIQVRSLPWDITVHVGEKELVSPSFKSLGRHACRQTMAKLFSSALGCRSPSNHEEY